MKNLTYIMHRLANQPKEHMEVGVDLFENILRLATKSKFDIVRLKDLYQNRISKKDSICFSFDDGWQSDYTIAVPSLLKKNFLGTFFIITKQVGNDGYLDWQQIIEMDKLGMEIGSHTASHSILTALDRDEIKNELSTSKKTLENRLKRKVYGLSIPHGEYNRQILKIAFEVGYQYVAISKPDINRSGTKIINRISITKQTQVEDFIQTINRPFTELFNQKIKYYLRKIIKKSFGISNYQKIRSWLIK
jgi:peptidoglycan/xylan/chitin deacetylase (PgdA/CDA1 family)